MTASLDLVTARARAESLMISTCTITRDGEGARVWDEEAGTYIDPEPVAVYSGPCKLQDSSRRAVRTEDAGEILAAIESLELHLPVASSGAVRRGDVARIDSNPLDPALVGRRFIVQASAAATAKTARRLPVEAVI